MARLSSFVTRMAKMYAEYIEVIVNSQKLTNDPKEKFEILLRTSIDVLPVDAKTVDILKSFFGATIVRDVFVNVPFGLNAEIDALKLALAHYVKNVLFGGRYGKYEMLDGSESS